MAEGSGQNWEQRVWQDEIARNSKLRLYPQGQTGISGSIIEWIKR